MDALQDREVRALQPQYRLMKLYINSFEDYTEQVKNYLAEIYETTPKEKAYDNINAILKDKVQTQSRNINWAKSIEKSIFDLNAGEVTPSKLMEDWLGQRFMILDFCKKELSLNPSAFRTSDLNTFLGLADDNYPTQLETVQDGEFISKLGAKTENDQFALFNHLIVSLYNITPRNQLSPKVKQMISASQKLWPLLQGETDESLDIESSFPDFEYYENCIKRSIPYPIILMNHVHKQMIFWKTAEEAGCSQIRLPKPDWLYVTYKKDATLEGANVRDGSVSHKKKKKKKKKKGRTH